MPGFRLRTQPARKLVAAGFAILTATAPARPLPVFLSDNHAESFAWITRSFDLDEPVTLVLVDAHSDATAAERSERIREELRRVANSEQRAGRVEQWRQNGTIQAFNWLEPLLPRPVDRVLWVARPILDAADRGPLHAEAVAALDGRLEFEPRAAGSFSNRWHTLGLTELTAWQPGEHPVVLAIDLDFFSARPDAKECFARLWHSATGWPGLAGVAFAISRPWLANDREADRLLTIALEAVRLTRGTSVEWDLSLDDRPDQSLRAAELHFAATGIPRWDILRAAPAIRATVAAHADKWKLHDPRRSVGPLLWGTWPAATWQVDGFEQDCDGVWRFPAGHAPVIRLQPPPDSRATGRVRWFARVPVRNAHDLLPHNRLGKGFAADPGRWIVETRQALGITEDFALDPGAWGGLLDRSLGCGRVRIEAEWQSGETWLPADTIELRGITGSGFRAGLSECFGMPYAFGIALAEDHGNRGVDTGWGSDCSNFLIHAWRRAGTRLEWGDPGQLRRRLQTSAVDLTEKSRPPLDPALLADGLVVDFGHHVAAVWEDREPLGVLDGNDLLAHHLGGVPEIVPLRTLARGRPPFALRHLPRGPSCRLWFGGDISPAGEPPPDAAHLTDSCRAADLAFANLEGIPATTPPMPGRNIDLRFPPQRLAALRAAGLDAVGLANNHAADAGVAHLATARALLLAADLGAAGAGATLAEALQPWRKSINGLHLAVFAASVTEAPPAGLDDPGVVRLPQHADPLAEVMRAAVARGETIVVLVHWGDENQPKVTDEQRHWARWFVVHGATVVAGSGPHVVQRTESHGGAAIAYSLGNTLWPTALQGTGNGGMWTVDLDSAGRILQRQIKPPETGRR